MRKSVLDNRLNSQLIFYLVNLINLDDDASVKQLSVSASALVMSYHFRAKP